MAHWRRYAAAGNAINESIEHESPEASVNGVVRQSVVAQLSNLRTHPCVAVALAKGEITLHGWVYDIESGSIEAFDAKSAAFISLSDNPEVRAS